MNENKKKIVYGAIGVIVLMGLFPPWSTVEGRGDRRNTYFGGYHFAATGGFQVDSVRYEGVDYYRRGSLPDGSKTETDIALGKMMDAEDHYKRTGSIYDAVETKRELNFPILLVQWLGVVIVAGGLFVAAKDKPVAGRSNVSDATYTVDPPDKDEPMRVEISCPSCQGRLRVPDGLGKIRVSCTFCKHAFHWSPDT